MKIIYALVLSCALLAPPMALRAEASSQQGNPDDRSRPPSRWWTNERYRQELKLSADQSLEIDRIVESSMARLKEDKAALDRAQNDFRVVMERPTSTERELLQAAERLEMARFSMSKERTTMLVRIHNVLTPDQRRGLDAIAKRNDGDRNRSR
jgi:Spy/CpxP family protein refolding chaperone